MSDPRWDGDDWSAATKDGIQVDDGSFRLASAIPDSVVDNFEPEDGNPAGPYESGDTLSDYYDGDLSVFTRDTETPLEGSYSLFAENPAQNQALISTSGDGLPRYPQKGEEFSVLARPRYNSGSEVGFAANGSEHGYMVRPQPGELQLNKRMGGFSKLATDGSAGISSGNTYEIVIEWHDGSGSQPDNTIVVTAYNYDTGTQTRGSEVGSVSATDSDGANYVGISFIEGRPNSSGCRWDKYRVIGGVQ